MQDKLAKIKLLLLDVDGVLIEAPDYLHNQELNKCFDVKDGRSVMLQRAGFEVGSYHWTVILMLPVDAL